MLSFGLYRYCDTVHVLEPLIFSCPADHVPVWQPRILLGMVEARSVDVKNTITQQHSLENKGRYNIVLDLPVAPLVQLVTSKPSDVGTRVRISVSSHELGFFLSKKYKIIIIITINAQQMEND